VERRFQTCGWIYNRYMRCRERTFATMTSCVQGVALISGRVWCYKKLTAREIALPTSLSTPGSASPILKPISASSTKALNSDIESSCGKVRYFLNASCDKTSDCAWFLCVGGCASSDGSARRSASGEMGGRKRVGGGSSLWRFSGRSSVIVVSGKVPCHTM
jgi:hypothetical protein